MTNARLHPPNTLFSSSEDTVFAHWKSNGKYDVVVSGSVFTLVMGATLIVPDNAVRVAVWSRPIPLFAICVGIDLFRVKNNPADNEYQQESNYKGKE